MATLESVSVINKIVDAKVERKDFTNRETGEVIEYGRLTIVVNLDGDETPVEFVPANAEGKSAYKILKLATDVE